MIEENDDWSAKMKHRRHGFTLVELLVVIGIIAVLISLLMPALSKVREVSRRTKCASTIRSLEQWCFIYANQNRGWLPPIHETGTQWPYYIDANSAVYDWRDQIATDLGVNQNFFYCPSNDEWNLSTHWMFPNGLKTDTASVWGYCYYPRADQYATGAWVWENPPRASFPGGTLIAAHSGNQAWTATKLTDSVYYDIMWTDITRSVSGNFGTSEGSNHIVGKEPTAGYPPQGNGGVNEGFLDGHVEWVPQNNVQERWDVLSSGVYYRGYW